MSIAERIRLARQAYGQAIALARVRADPASWARLRMAARNLNDALRDALREHAQQGPPDDPLGA